jgi:hypothetical protein
MSASGTTSIDQLPINPQNNANVNSVPSQQINQNNLTQTQPNMSETQNIKIENYGQQLSAERKTDPAIQQLDYSSQLSSVLKEASAVGATVLPSRDIPQNTIPLQHDSQTKPNYIPDKGNDYIGDILNKEQILKDNTRKQNQSDNIDYLYQQIQLPLLVAVIYFLFQLPVFRKNILTFLPSLFNKDGNPNLYGYVFNSMIFGLLYCILIKGLKELS